MRSTLLIDVWQPESCILHKKSRLLQSHFGLDNVKDMLRANDLSKLREVWLLHLSDSNSDADRFKREVQEITGTVVQVARR